MITSVIFDFDDTLNDYQSVRDEALRECADLIDEQYRQPFLKFYLTFELSLFKLFTLKEISLEVYRHKRFLFPLLLATVDNGNLNDLAAQMNMTYMEIGNTRVRLFPDAIECLQRLKQKDLKLYIFTNGPAEDQKRRIAIVGIEKYFDGIFISQEIGTSKPDLAAFKHVLESIGEKPENVMMVGDSYENDVFPAREMGMQACHLDRRRTSSNTKILSSLAEMKI